MGFQISYGDITKFKGDAIVNSLGTDTTVYGKLCGSIIAADNNPAYVQKLKDINGKAKVLDCFIFERNYLNAKYIISIVTPYAKADKDYKQYCEAYKAIFNTARKNKLYKIAVPLIGTGPNGYNHITANNLVKKMANAYCYIYPEMDITLYHLSAFHAKTTTKDSTEKEVAELKCWILEKKTGIETQSHDYNYVFNAEYFESSDKSNPIFYDNSRRKDLLSQTEMDDHHQTIEMPAEHYDCPGLYINTYLELRYDDDSKLIRESKNAIKFLTSQKVYEHLFEPDRKVKDKEKLLLISIALRMNYEECEEFLGYFNFSIKTMSRNEALIYTFVTERYYDVFEIRPKLALLDVIDDN